MIRPLLWLPLAALSLTPALAQEGSLEKRVMKLHELAGGTLCERSEGQYLPDDSYREWTFEYQPSWGEEADKETVTLVQVFCGSGAYNLQHAWYWEREFDGLQQLAFASPAFETKYENDDLIEGKLESVTVTGMTAETILVNSEFDPETLTITSRALWRGIGDASSNGTWTFQDGAFVLVKFDIDASYDGEINPETVLDYSR